MEEHASSNKCRKWQSSATFFTNESTETKCKDRFVDMVRETEKHQASVSSKPGNKIHSPTVARCGLLNAVLVFSERADTAVLSLAPEQPNQPD